RVAVVDTRVRRVVTELRDPPPLSGEGATPNALALSADGTRLFAAEADANAVALFDLAPATADVPVARGEDGLAGRVPVGWYPTSLLALGDTLLVASGKGLATGANPHGPHTAPQRDPLQYTLGQLHGALVIAPLARVSGAE